MTGIPKRSIIGTEVSICDYAGVLDEIDSAVTRREALYICCVPASSLIFARRDPALRGALSAAAIVTPDGMGVVYAARLLGERIGDRVYGPDLMLYQCERAVAAGHRVWLYGGFDNEALATLRETLTARFPKLQIVGGHSPAHRPLSASEADALIAQIESDAPDIIWVGLGSPKQELWMREMRSSLSAPVLAGVGAAFDFHAGRVGQAPRWMQDRGLEWLYRLLREPRRLAARYLTTLPAFATLVLVQAARERIPGSR